ncbi:ABC transporter permease [Ruminococcus sp. OA3]|uniref:ABC transporter permease subunit n=1 Tax=Ruminococcus sp. OA3 TaxID=2914164 RepID=UPI001F0581D5|nr:ABC transporter permease subunit [Ruminococcus sp. OA3]MCH1983567.1 ABC transporter permease [Ruminococcus sp. OA3]
MLSTTLFRKELKSNYILLVIFLGVLTMYAVMIVMMFDPKTGDSLRAMAESMPQIFAAFGMGEVGTTLLEFITGYLYGMLFVIFPAVFIIILANRLVAKYVDNGSMACLLSAPHKRRKIVTTQAVFLTVCLVFLVAFVTVLVAAVSGILFPGELEVPAFLRVNVGLLGLLIFFGGACFLSSCLFNDSRRATGIGAGIVVCSVLVQMISQTGEKFRNIRYVTPLTLFDINGLTAADGDAWLACAALYASGILLMAAGVAAFSRRNLPL